MMRSARAVLGLAVGILPLTFPVELGAQPGPRTQARFQELESGIAVFQGSVLAGGTKVDVTAVRVALSSHRVAVVVSPLEAGASLATFLKTHQAKVVLSGGFMKSFYPPIPLGLVKHNGKFVNRAAKGDLLTGILAIRDRKPVIRRFQAAECDDRSHDCLQSGPLLVRNGKSELPQELGGLLRSTRSLVEGSFARAVVGILQEGHFLVALTGKVALAPLVEVLSRPQVDGGFGCLDALNLSGAETAGLLVRAGGRTIEVGGQHADLPNAIIVR
jgi:hypothetical protein